MRKSLKIALIAIGMLIVVLLIGNNNVQAATYQSTLGGAKIMVVTENGKITITEEQEDGTSSIIEYEGIGEIIGFKEYSLIMKQEEINKYLNAREIPYTVKQKVDSSATKAELEDGTELEIETINNDKWVVYSGVIKYDAADIGKIWDGCIVGYKDDDIRNVSLGDENSEIDGFYINGNKTEDGYINAIWNVVSIETEKTAGALVYHNTSFVNERNINYEQVGGSGGFIMGYTKLHPIYDLTKFNNGLITMVPTKADLSKVYLKLSMSAYQGESIVLKDGKGTLYYEGKEGSMYIYKNKVSNLKIKENEIAEFSYKLTNGYQLDGHLNSFYRLDPNAVEAVVKVEDSTKNNQNIESKVGISYWGDATFNIAKVEKTDSIYTRVDNEINSKLPKYRKILYLDILDIYRVEGDFGGKLTITFNIDEKYNGKYYHVSHYTGLGEYESFDGVIEKGKITITVDSLSPFGIAIYEKTAGTSTKTEDRKLDDEPPTGINGTNIVIAVTLAVITLGAGGMIKNKKD